jgi:hypothetical protein
MPFYIAGFMYGGGGGGGGHRRHYHHHHYLLYAVYYTYIPETNHVPKEYNIAAILSLLFAVPMSLVPALALMYFYISTF